MVDLGNLAKFTNLAYAMMTARHWPWVAARNSCKKEFNREGRNADGPRATRFSVIRTCIMSGAALFSVNLGTTENHFLPVRQRCQWSSILCSLSGAFTRIQIVGGDGILDLSERALETIPSESELPTY